ncbi:MAG: hypothetical protein WCR72_18125 [Bacteroidota bacterium]
MFIKRTKKIRKYFLKGFVTLVLTLWVSIGQAFCQEKFSLSGGIGFPELLNIGIQYQQNQTRLGINLGGLPYKDDLLGNFFLYAVSADASYYLGRVQGAAEVRQWYLKSGLTYFAAGNLDKHVFLNGRIGKDFNISGK